MFVNVPPPIKNFNSIKVRLERCKNQTSVNLSIFQFHKGAIRTFNLHIFRDILLYFNSIKVRLERGSSCSCKRSLSHFNSIKVRLELSWDTLLQLEPSNFNSIKVRLELDLPSISYRLLIFQFHKGAIRTFSCNWCRRNTRISIP